MRIYFSGAHSTGKTTLARYISKEYNLPLLNEVARTVLAEKEYSFDTLRTDIDAVNNYQVEVFNRQIQEEQKFTAFVSDRSFDNLAYMAQHCSVLNKFINSPEIVNYVNFIKNNKSIMFFIRPSKATLKNDGVRESLSWDGIIAIDAMIKFLFEMYDINYISIHSDSMQERIKTIKSIIALSQ